MLPINSIIALEIINISIRENKHVTGIKAGKCERLNFFFLTGLFDKFG